jgi:hypothetical protein
MGKVGPVLPLEVSPEAYNELDMNLRTAVAVAGAVRSIIPPHMALRLDGALEHCREAVGKFIPILHPPESCLHITHISCEEDAP